MWIRISWDQITFFLTSIVIQDLTTTWMKCCISICFLFFFEQIQEEGIDLEDPTIGLRIIPIY